MIYKTECNFLILIIICTTVILFTAEQKTYAAGNTYYASSDDNLAEKLDLLSAGDTLILQDGIYYSAMDIDDIIGTASNLITIKAQNEGKVTIDGEYTNRALYVGFSKYINIEGINFRNSKGSVIILGYSSCYINLKRCTAHNAEDPGGGNNHVIKVSANHCLIEDCSATGTGRYSILAYNCDDVTFRRCYAKWSYHSGFVKKRAAPRFAFGIYGAKDVTLENCIGHNAIPRSEGRTNYGGIWITHADYNEHIPVNITVKGCIFYNNYDHGMHFGGDLTRAKPPISENVDVINCAFFDHTWMECPGPSENYPDYADRGTAVYYNSANGTFRNNTFYNNNTVLDIRDTTTVPVNCAFVDNENIYGSIHPTHKNHSYCGFYDNTNLNLELDSTDRTDNPGYNESKYGKGAYFFIPDNSPYKGAGQGGDDIGANILYQYENGKLTSNRLWPWPMEDRIADSAGVSVTWETNGGLWKTLEGIYATPTPVPAGVTPKR